MQVSEIEQSLVSPHALPLNSNECRGLGARIRQAGVRGTDLIHTGVNRSDIWVGIDVSQAQLDVAVRPTSETWSVTIDATGSKQLTKTLKKQTPSLIV